MAQQDAFLDEIDALIEKHAPTAAPAATAPADQDPVLAEVDAILAPYEVQQTEREATSKALEIGKWPGDESIRPTIEKGGRKAFDAVRDTRIPQMRQVHKARETETALRDADSFTNRATAFAKSLFGSEEPAPIAQTAPLPVPAGPSLSPSPLHTPTPRSGPLPVQQLVSNISKEDKSAAGDVVLAYKRRQIDLDEAHRRLLDIYGRYTDDPDQPDQFGHTLRDMLAQTKRRPENPEAINPESLPPIATMVERYKAANPLERGPKVGPDKLHPFERAGDAPPQSSPAPLGPLGTEITGTTGEGRPIVQNPDGTVSTERTTTLQHPGINGGQWTNIPTMFGGKQVSEDEAAEIIARNGGRDPETGQVLPGYASLEEATAAAVARSKQLGQQIDGTPDWLRPSAPPAALPDRPIQFTDRAEQPLPAQEVQQYLGNSEQPELTLPEIVVRPDDQAPTSPSWLQPGLANNYEQPEVLEPSMGRAAMPTEAAAPPQTTIGQDIAEAANNFMRGFADVSGSALKSIAIASKTVDEYLPEALKNPADIKERMTYKIGQAVQDMAAKAFPADPARQKEFIGSVLPRALGSMSAFLVGGIGGAVAKAPMTTTALMGAGAQGTEQFEDAAVHGADPATQQQAFWMGVPVGATEAIPIGGLIEKFNNATGGRFMHILKTAGVAAAEEFAQEFFQTTAGNVIAKDILEYDTQRSRIEGATEAGEAGGAAGAILGILVGALGGRRAMQQRTGAADVPAANEPLAQGSPASAPATASAPPPIAGVPARDATDAIVGLPPELHIAGGDPFLVKKQPAPSDQPTRQSAEPFGPPSPDVRRFEELVERYTLPTAQEIAERKTAGRLPVPMPWETVQRPADELPSQRQVAQKKVQDRTAREQVDATQELPRVGADIPILKGPVAKRGKARTIEVVTRPTPRERVVIDEQQESVQTPAPVERPAPIEQTAPQQRPTSVMKGDPITPEMREAMDYVNEYEVEERPAPVERPKAETKPSPVETKAPKVETKGQVVETPKPVERPAASEVAPAADAASFPLEASQPVEQPEVRSDIASDVMSETHSPFDVAAREALEAQDEPRSAAGRRPDVKRDRVQKTTNPEPEATSARYDVDTEDFGVVPVHVRRQKDGSVSLIDLGENGRNVEYPAAFARERSDQELLRYTYEPIGFRGATATSTTSGQKSPRHVSDITPTATAEPPAPIDTAAHEAATSPTNDRPEPTQGQKAAGNYKKGHVNIAGLDISIENPQGSVRSGTDAKGKPWKQEMKSHYGYIRGVPKGKDGDHLDVFVKPGTPEDYSGPVYVIDQKNPKTDRFDEHKIILGSSSLAEAKQLYHENYAKGWKGMQAVTRFSMPEFREWLQTGNHQKPAMDQVPTVEPSSPIPAPRVAAALPAQAQQPAQLPGAQPNPKPVSSTVSSSTEPWQMTRAEFVAQKRAELAAKARHNPNLASRAQSADFGRQAGVAHAGIVQQAIAEGKSVPEAVLADYPDVRARIQTDRSVSSATKRARKKAATRGEPQTEHGAPIRQFDDESAPAGPVSNRRSMGIPADADPPISSYRNNDALRTRGVAASQQRERRLSANGLSRRDNPPVADQPESSQAPSGSETSPSDFGAPQRDAPETAETVSVPRRPPRASLKHLTDIERQAREVADDFLAAADQAKSKPRPTRPRIPVAPLLGGAPKTLANIVIDVQKGTGKKLTTGKAGRGQAGVYKPGSATTLVRYSGDLDTTAHELAHALDDEYSIVKAYAGKPSSPFDGELKPFGEHGSVQTTGPRSTATYWRAEGVAEWTRAWIVNPLAAEAAAPTFTQHFKQVVPPHIQKALQIFSDDIRHHAGQSAHAKIMANVEWETPKSPLLAWLTGTRTAPGPGFRLTVGDQLATELTDRLTPFMKAVRYAQGQRNAERPLPGKDPALLARLYMGVNAKLDDVFEHGMIDDKLERVTPGGLTWLLGSLDPQSLEREMQEVASLMIAERTIEKAEQLGRDRISGIGAGIESDVSVAKGRLAELKENAEKFARLQEAASRYRQWADANLRYLVNKGRLSAEQYEQIKANNEYYVAMQRMIEVSPGEELVVSLPRGTAGRKLGTVGQPVQSFAGSTRAIKNPYHSLMDATNHAIREADRNEVLGLFRDLLTMDRAMHEGQVADLASVGRLAATGEKHTIPIYKNGTKEVWQFHPELYKALKGVEEGAYKFPWVLTILPRILRATIVNAPPFALRNLIRDAWQRTIVSRVGSKPWDVLKPYSQDEITRFQRSGGDQAGHYYTDSKEYARALTFAMQELSGKNGTILVNPARLGRGYLNLMQGSERQGRMAEYRRAFQHAKKELGYDDYHASLWAAGQARDLLDFAVAGNWTQLVNQLVPFTNAAVQGLRRNIKGARENPSGVALRFGIYALIPSLINFAWNYLFGDGDDLDEYRQLPPYQRDLFYNYKLGPDQWLSIPKAFEVGVLATTFERAMDYGLGNTQAFEGHVGAFLRTLLPIDEAAFGGPFQGIFQAVANYDFFRDRPIVPRYEENLALDLRNTHRASRLGQAIQAAIGVDARKIDFVVEQQFGYFGRYATKASDIGRDEKRGFGLDTVGLFRGSPATAALDVQKIKEIATERGLVASRSKAVDKYETVSAVPTRPTEHVKNPDAVRFGVFRKLLDAYYEAKGSEAKDAAAKVLRREAAALRTIWEKAPPRQQAEEKVEITRKRDTGEITKDEASQAFKEMMKPKRAYSPPFPLPVAP